MYFYKNSNGAWIVGPTQYSVKTAKFGGMSPSAINNTGTVGNWAKVDISIGLSRYPNQVVTAINKNAAGDTYANFAEFYAAVESFFVGNNDIANGEYDATLSDTVDLAYPGWIQPTLLAGNIKYTTVNGDVVTRAYDLKETSLVRVSRVWSTGTTAGMGIKVYH